jgi:hypothetical protein
MNKVLVLPPPLGSKTLTLTGMGIQYSNGGIPDFSNLNMYIKLYATTGNFPKLNTSFPYVPIYVQQSLANKRNILGNITNHNNLEIFDLVGASFIGYTPSKPKQFWIDMLNEMRCHGSCWQINNPISYGDCTFFETNANNSTHKWNTQNRFKAKKIGEGPSFLSEYLNYSNPNNMDLNTEYLEFSSLDYMLAFNLFKLNYTNDGISDKMVKNITFRNMPLYLGNNKYIGDAANPGLVRAVFNLNLFNKHSNNAKIEYKAGSSIKMLPGFKTATGAVVKATIEDYDCTPEVSTNGIIQARNSLNTGDNYTIIEDNLLTEPEQPVPTLVDTFGDNVPDCYITVYANDTMFLYPDTINCTFHNDGSVTYNDAANQNKIAPVVNNVGSINNVYMYPNPAKEILNLEITCSGITTANISIADSKGLSMLNANQSHQLFKGYNKVELNVSTLPTGVYLLKIIEDKNIKIYKFVKE